LALVTSVIGAVQARVAPVPVHVAVATALVPSMTMLQDVVFTPSCSQKQVNEP
jgi:hypothetical protein